MALCRLDVGAPVDLWVANIAGQPSPGDMAMLSNIERLRAGRLRFDRDRRRYLAAHVGLRRVLADYSGIPPDQQRFAVGPYGKPVLAGFPRLGFNLSYAGDQALIGVAHDAAIGVDAESAGEVADLEAMAATVFARSEYAAFLAVPPGAARCAAFLRGWTRKEACVKALGTGLSTLPSSFVSGTGEAAQMAKLETDHGCADIEVGSFMIGNRVFAAWARLI